ncbi:MAG: hypothetical protein M2R45_03055 [Verrucomicrobia subdivision 3 bacterium]|nr:hypothetical protein [Limisphaerales bacterium]MCS1416541.1 hypothetical protein [Limisphaerales bacterium]
MARSENGYAAGTIFTVGESIPDFSSFEDENQAGSKRRGQMYPPKSVESPLLIGSASV